MLPYKHYPAQVIESAVESFERGKPVNEVASCAEESTLRRWRRQFKAILPGLCGQLQVVVKYMTRKDPALCEYAKTYIARLKIHLETLGYADSGHTVLGRTFLKTAAYHVCVG